MSKPEALIAGIAGPTPDADTRATLNLVAHTLRARLHAKWQVPAEVVPAVEGQALLDAAREKRRWWVLVGQVREDPDFGPLLLTREGQGLEADKLAKLLKKNEVDGRVLIIDVPDATALRDLDFGPCAVKAIGPGLAEKLAAALLPTIDGEVTAGAVAAALGGTSDSPRTVLNQRQVGEAGIEAGGRERVAYLEGLKAVSDRLVLRQAIGGDPDAEQGPQRSRALSDIYEPLFTTGGKEAKKRQNPDEAEPPKTAHHRVAEHRCVFLVGDPGSGKTSFLRRLATQLCEVALGERSALQGLPAEPLPVFFRLAEFAGKPEPDALLTQALDRLCCADGTHRLPASVAEAALRAGQLVLLFDGLDEVPEADGLTAEQRRQRMADALTRLALVQARSAHVIATSRPAAAKSAAPTAPFQRFDLQPLENPQVIRVAHNWLTLREATAAEAEPLARQLVADLGVHAAVDRLARNPLTLGLICVVLYRRGRLPRDRNDLYDELINLLLEDRGRADRDRVGRRRTFLTDLAWAWWQKGGIGQPDTALREDVCLTLLQPRGLTEDQARAEVRFLDERTGLLTWVGNERGHRLYRFAHRSYVEFLVACRLTEDAKQETLANAGTDPGWREVALMYVAELARQQGKGDKEPAWAYIRGLLEQAKSPRNGWEKRASSARLAAECIADWREQAGELGGDVDALQAVFLDPDVSRQMPVAERVAFWTAVGPHNQVVKGDRWATVPAGRFWFGAAPKDPDAIPNEAPARVVEMSGFRIHRWPVTVAEYAVFVEEGGYADETLWSADGWRWRQAEGITFPGRWPVPGRPHHPVTDVSWYEAEAWCAWASRQQGCLIMLPSEAQWEYAARGAHDPQQPVPRYPWGVDDEPDRRAGHPSWSAGPVPPGAFPRGIGPFGTWDQSGNVWEWTRDDYAGKLAEGGQDPCRPAAEGGNRALRGGAFGDAPLFLRVSCRISDPPRRRYVFIGFRCVCPLPEDI